MSDNTHKLIGYCTKGAYSYNLIMANADVIPRVDLVVFDKF